MSSAVYSKQKTYDAVMTDFNYKLKEMINLDHFDHYLVLRNFVTQPGQL